MFICGVRGKNRNVQVNKFYNLLWQGCLVAILSLMAFSDKINRNGQFLYF